MNLQDHSTNLDGSELMQCLLFPDLPIEHYVHCLNPVFVRLFYGKKEMGFKIMARPLLHHHFPIRSDVKFAIHCLGSFPILRSRPKHLQLVVFGGEISRMLFISHHVSSGDL